MQHHLYLGGIKHSGKTSIAQRLAVRLTLPSYDLDALILNRIAPHHTIRSFYATEGKERFQQMEHSALAALLPTLSRRAIIALGGGACDNEALMDLVKTSGSLIYLKVDEEILWQRIIAGGTPPFLDSAHPRASFATLYRKRDERYSKMCDLLVDLSDGLGIDEATDLVASALGREE
ncbi:MAG: shikimate kinase [Sphaerochaeta sp.]|jgi:shikimate kinase|nr:hypothetical protein [Sphaerochaeta sp.]MDX9914990.1 shikimate kinase [Sphaerochaeta sp.]